MSGGNGASEHLATPALARILSGRAHRADARAAVRHLVAVCPECAAGSVEAAAVDTGQLEESGDARAADPAA